MCLICLWAGYGFLPAGERKNPFKGRWHSGLQAPNYRAEQRPGRREKDCAKQQFYEVFVFRCKKQGITTAGCVPIATRGCIATAGCVSVATHGCMATAGCIPVATAGCMATAGCIPVTTAGCMATAGCVPVATVGCITTVGCVRHIR